VIGTAHGAGVRRRVGERGSAFREAPERDAVRSQACGCGARRRGTEEAGRLGRLSPLGGTGAAGQATAVANARRGGSAPAPATGRTGACCES